MKQYIDKADIDELFEECSIKELITNDKTVIDKTISTKLID